MFNRTVAASCTLLLQRLRYFERQPARQQRIFENITTQQHNARLLIASIRVCCESTMFCRGTQSILMGRTSDRDVGSAGPKVSCDVLSLGFRDYHIAVKQSGTRA